jgi:hypothetical protein
VDSPELRGRAEQREVGVAQLLQARLHELGGSDATGSYPSGTGDQPAIRVRDLAIMVARLEQLLDAELAPLVLDEGPDDESYLINREVVAEDAARAAALGRFDPPVRPEWFWELAIAVNAAFKGLLGSQGESGHICASVTAVAIELNLDNGWQSLVDQFTNAVSGTATDGDVVVVADAVVAAAQRRLAPRGILSEPDPKQIAPARLAELARRWADRLGFPVTPLHLLLADEYGDDQATVGCEDHNFACAELARAVADTNGVLVDVVISDTDTGLDTRTPLIGTVTVAATPLGATAGLSLYDAMRCATAAEFTRGHRRRIPFVVCVPASRRRVRDGIGQLRPYRGALDARREPPLGR